MKDRERDILRRAILELLIRNSEHYTSLDKKVCAMGHSFVTTNTFRSQFQYLLTNGYIERIARGVYQIMPKGAKYHEVLTLS
ncbi:MAG TPA: hypothetical protein ENN36_05690 [Candidatus Bathyarchaeota archaeon]|nr:hypothetical protein [Candidatus Bathyarchaeota archaeon]